jgi:hypothetical protein
MAMIFALMGRSFAHLGAAKESRLPLPKGISVYAGPNLDTVPGFNTFLGRNVDLMLVFFNQTSWANYALSIPYACNLATSDKPPPIWSVPLCAVDGTIAEVNTGARDALFTTVATSILAAHKPGVAIMVRIGWEFNISGGMPWYALGNTAAYVTAYQRIWGIFRGVSSRFRFDWCPAANTIASAGFDPILCYPGNSYVDVIGMDIYQDVTYAALTQQGLDAFNYYKTADRGLDWHVSYAAGKNKPRAYSEHGNNGPEQQRWNSRQSGLAGGLYDYIRDNPVQYHSHWEDLESGISARISNGDNPKIAALYKKAFGKPVIETASSFNKLVNVNATIPFTCYQTVTWSVVSGPGSFTGNVLTVPAQASGSATTVVKATGYWGDTTTQTITTGFVSAYSFVNSEASAYVARMGVQPDEGRKAIIDTFVGALKAASIYTKMKAFYLLASHDSSAALLNAVANANNATVSGSPGFVADRGYTGLASPAALLDLNLVPNNASPFVQNSASMTVWHLNDLQTPSPTMGTNDGSTYLNPRNASNQFGACVNDWTNLLVANSNATGIFIANRSAIGARQLYKNGSSVGSDATASAGTSSTDFLALSGTNVFPDEHQLGALLIGSSLTSTDAAALTTALQAYADAIVAPR